MSGIPPDEPPPDHSWTPRDEEKLVEAMLWAWSLTLGILGCLLIGTPLGYLAGMILNTSEDFLGGAFAVDPNVDFLQRACVYTI